MAGLDEAEMKLWMIPRCLLRRFVDVDSGAGGVFMPQLSRDTLRRESVERGVRP